MTKFDNPESRKPDTESSLSDCEPIVDLAQSARAGVHERSPHLFANRPLPIEESTATEPAMRLGNDWISSHDSYAERAKRGGVDTLFLGDSITWGMKPEILHANFGPNALNFGIPGDRTQNLLWRMQNGELDFPQNDRPKVAVMLIGTNNFSDFESVPPATNDEIINGIKANINELRKDLPDTKILVVGILPRGETATDPLRARIKQINAQVGSSADDKHIFFADIGKDLVQPDGSISPEIMADFLHPTHDVGNARMLDAIKKKMDRVNKSS